MVGSKGRSVIVRHVETTDIYENLKGRLATGALTPGRKLKPADLQKDYACSQNTLRDVLMRLCTIGLVEFEMQKGFRATSSSPDQMRDVARFRLLLEREGATASMEYGGVAWEADLAAAHHKLLHIERRIADAGDIGSFMPLWTDAERAFHETLISVCGSPLLIDMFSQVYLRFRQQFAAQQRNFRNYDFDAIIVEHQAIVDGALARDQAACCKAIQKHLERHL